MQRRPTRRARSPVPGIVLGTVGLAFSGWMFVGAKSDLQAYAGDPSCGDGCLVNAVSGQCRTATVRIDRIYRTTGKNAHRYVILGMPDGSQLTVIYGQNRYGDVWRGVARAGDRAATAEFFRNAVVALRTGSGLADTADMPADRLDRWALIGIVAGAMGCFSALMEVLRLR